MCSHLNSVPISPVQTCNSSPSFGGFEFSNFRGNPLSPFHATVSTPCCYFCNEVKEDILGLNTNTSGGTDAFQEYIYLREKNYA